MTAAAPASPELSIPPVTQHDLAAFHTTHFGPQTPQPPPPNPSLHQKPSPHNDGDASQLGHYPDGTPRTLTAAQIAIFRHTEIHTLLRLRARRQHAERDAPAADASASNQDQDQDRDQDRDQPRKRRRKTPGPRAPSQRLSSVAARHVVPDDPRGRTTRRVARELDASGEAEALLNIQLDY